jgi:UDP-glucose 4-epimerase
LYQNIWDQYRNVIGIWIRQALSNEPITIYGDGSQTRAFSDVACIMNPLYKLMEKDCDVVNIGANQIYRIIDAAQIFQKVVARHGFNIEIKHLEKRDEVKHAWADHTLAEKVLGFEDSTNFEDLVERMFLWAKTLPRQSVRKMNYEVTKNMYSFWR